MSFQIKKIEAESLYVTEGLSVPKISQRIKMAETTVYKWCKDGDWRKKRDEYNKQYGSIISDVRQLRFDLIKKALKSKNPQDVYAFVAVERLARMHNDDIDDQTFAETSPDQLKEAALRALKRLEGAKDVKITEIQAALKIAEAMEKRGGQNEKKPKNISSDTIAQVKSMYGLG